MTSKDSLLKRLFRIITNIIKTIWSDLSSGDLISTLQKDLKSIYQFYLDDETRSRLSAMKRFRRWVYLTVLVLKSVILKLTPTRRVLLLLSILMIYFGSRSEQNSYLQLGFLILLFILIFELKDKLLAFDELAEARNLQLSMLPKTFPEHPNIDIAFYMKTANTVGGDYYDFRETDDGTLIIVIGDATGHSMKAGVIVTAMKSLFGAIGSNPDISAFFNSCTKIFKGMNLGYLYMSLTLIRIKNHLLTASIAGMPPILLYKSKSKTIEEISEGGVPLGFIECQYKKTDIELEPGDTILLMSDGFPELLNDKEEMLDYPKIKEYFKEAVHRSPDEIISRLSNAAEKWRNNIPQEDDIAIVVLQAK